MNSVLQKRNVNFDINDFSCQRKKRKKRVELGSSEEDDNKSDYDTPIDDNDSKNDTDVDDEGNNQNLKTTRAKKKVKIRDVVKRYTGESLNSFSLGKLFLKIGKINKNLGKVLKFRLFTFDSHPDVVFNFSNRLILNIFDFLEEKSQD